MSLITVETEREQLLSYQEISLMSPFIIGSLADLSRSASELPSLGYCLTTIFLIYFTLRTLGRMSAKKEMELLRNAGMVMGLQGDNTNSTDAYERSTAINEYLLRTRFNPFSIYFFTKVGYNEPDTRERSRKPRSWKGEFSGVKGQVERAIHKGTGVGVGEETGMPFLLGVMKTDIKDPTLRLIRDQLEGSIHRLKSNQSPESIRRESDRITNLARGLKRHRAYVDEFCRKNGIPYDE